MSRGSSTRSAGRATSFVLLDQVPVRWKLAGASAVLTLVILCGFAVAVGKLTSDQIRHDFDEEVAASATELAQKADARVNFFTGELTSFRPNLNLYVAGEDAVARLVREDGAILRRSQGSPNLGAPRPGPVEVNGYRVETRPITSPLTRPLFLQYARPLRTVEATVRKVRFFLLGGVVGGAALALLAGLMIARRAMAPIAELTETAREIQRTRDPDRRIEVSGADDDEVAELARTLDGMLQALAAASAEQEELLLRQRRFVADASHELRTPLTSVLANLDFLAETLDGEQEDAARSALRSSQRMRRLVQDLLLLARADARREAPHAPFDVGQVVVEAAAELEPVTEGHALVVDAMPALVDGTRDDVHRLALNLMENAIKHTPPGTQIRAAVERANGHVELVVEDDGPGIDPELRDRVFERFVRGEGDRGGSFGLGLAIVRAVAEAHGGTVSLGTPADGRGTRFVVRLPAAEVPAEPFAATSVR